MSLRGQIRGTLLATLLAGVSPAAFAQTSMQDQINSVYNAQERNRQNEQAAWEAQQADIQRNAQRQEAALRARAEASASAQRAKEASSNADKKRNQSYDDQLRSLEVQRQQLDLQAKKARVDRENDYIDQELQRRSANTDVVRSEADANRNVSSGVKSYLDQAGQAEIKKQARP